MNNITIQNYTFPMDPYLKSNLDIIKEEAIPNKWDALFIVTGKEGAGKTTFATQSALYLDHNFTLNNIVFDPESFCNIIDACKPESSIIWDEAITGAMTIQHASRISQVIISKLTQIRKKRLKIFLCFPYLYMLNKYFISRCVGSFYIYARGFTSRGHYFCYNQHQTMWLYGLQKEKYNRTPDKAYYASAKTFYAKFGPTFCADEEAYDDKKEKARLTMGDDGDNKWRTRAILSTKLAIEKGATQKEVAKRWNMTQQYVQTLVKQQTNTLII